MNKAEEYRAAVAKARTSEGVDFTAPSGYTWKLRRPNLQGFIATGRVPQSLLETGMKSWQAQGKMPVDAKPEMSAEETMANLIFMREIVREACVSPKIAVGSSDPDTIDPAEMFESDFMAIYEWVMTGGENAAVLRNFRSRLERGTPDARPRGKKHRNKTERAVESTG